MSLSKIILSLKVVLTISIITVTVNIKVENYELKKKMKSLETEFARIDKLESEIAEVGRLRAGQVSTEKVNFPGGWSIETG